jgi:hypothetical protein
LQLDYDERSRLFALAGAPDPATTTERSDVTPQMLAVPVKLNPYRACVRGGKYDLLAFKTALHLLLAETAVPVHEREEKPPAVRRKHVLYPNDRWWHVPGDL